MPRSAEESEPVREDDLVCQYERLEFCVIAHGQALQPPASGLQPAHEAVDFSAVKLFLLPS